MEAQDGQIRWHDLISELVRDSSKTQVAKKLDVNFKEIGRWMQGKAIPQGHNRDTILQLCELSSINWRKHRRVIPIYDISASYDRNVAEGPQGLPTNNGDRYIPMIPVRILDFDLNSPLGVPASNLTINSRWIEPLTKLGFDIITAKTVRTREYHSHPVPNILYLPELNEPIRAGAKIEYVRATSDLPERIGQDTSLVNSFGMPSTEPRLWQDDLQRTKNLLAEGQILVASIVGTPKVDGNDVLSRLVNDFAECARLAWEVGPHFLEKNFSCPNVYGKEGSIFHDAELAARICKKTIKELPDAKILLKIGYLPPPELRAFLEATYKFVSGYTAINTLSAPVVTFGGQRQEQAFPGLDRATAGISGVAIRDHAVEVISNIRKFAEEKKKDLVILGVGGVATAADAKSFLDAGANGVQICTAAIFNPFIAIEIRKHLAAEMHPRISSRLLDKTGFNVPFEDQTTAAAFESTLKVSAKNGIPLEITFRALQKNWLNAYLGEMASLQSSGSTVKMRQKPPSESQIEAWARDESKKQKDLGRAVGS